ncbi:MAG: BNR-4 repeat-containing protein [Planctomycetota bacterium]
MATLTADWPFNEATAGYVDAVGGVTATRVNGPTTGIGPIVGVLEPTNAALFAGDNNQHCTIPGATAALRPSQGMRTTIFQAAGLRTSSVTEDTAHLFVCGEWQLFYLRSAGQFRLQVIGSSNTAVLSAITVSGLEHANLAVIYDPDNNRVGLKTNDQATEWATLAAPAGTSTNTMYLGSRDGVSRPWIGELARLRCYGEVLTDAEMDAIYNGGLLDESVTLRSTEALLFRDALSGPLNQAKGSPNFTGTGWNQIASNGTYQAIAYYRGSGRVFATWRTMDGAWQEAVNTGMQLGPGGYDNHWRPTVAIDGDHRVHVIGDARNSAMKYVVSSPLTSGPPVFGSNIAPLVSAGTEDSATYVDLVWNPITSKLYERHRDGGSGAGNVHVSERTVAPSTWAGATGLGTNGMLLDGEVGQDPDYNAYVSNWAIDPNTGDMHVSWIWRRTGDGSTNSNLHHAVYTGSGLVDLAGQPVSVPQQQSDTDTLVATISEGSGLGMYALALDAAGNPAILYKQDDASGNDEFRVIVHDGSAWSTPEVVQDRNADGTDNVNRPTLVYVNGDFRVLMVDADANGDRRPRSYKRSGGSWPVEATPLTSFSLATDEQGVDGFASAVWPDMNRLYHGDGGFNAVAAPSNDAFTGAAILLSGFPGGGVLDPSVLKASMVGADGNLKPSLVTDAYAGGAGSGDQLRADLRGLDGALAPRLLDADGDPHPSLLK